MSMIDNLITYTVTKTFVLPRNALHTMTLHGHLGTYQPITFRGLGSLYVSTGLCAASRQGRQRRYFPWID